MGKHVKFVLLIDDDRATNFFNSIMISKHARFDEVHYVQSGYDAIKYLQQVISGTAKKPDLIFLDINMPGMNGWDFLTRFEELDATANLGIKVILLSTSSDPNEVKKSMTNYNVEDFISKPLSIKLLDDVVDTHFVVVSH